MAGRKRGKKHGKKHGKQPDRLSAHSAINKQAHGGAQHGQPAAGFFASALEFGNHGSGACWSGEDGGDGGVASSTNAQLAHDGGPPDDADTQPLPHLGIPNLFWGAVDAAELPGLLPCYCPLPRGCDVRLSCPHAFRLVGWGQPQAWC